MDNLFEQIATIQKASAYDIVRKQNEELLAKNKELADRVKFLEDLILEYTEKMKNI